MACYCFSLHLCSVFVLMWGWEGCGACTLGCAHAWLWDHTRSTRLAGVTLFRGDVHIHLVTVAHTMLAGTTHSACTFLVVPTRTCAFELWYLCLSGCGEPGLHADAVLRLKRAEPLGLPLLHVGGIGGSLFLTVPGQVLVPLEPSFWMTVVSAILHCILGQFLLSVILLNIMWVYHGRWGHWSTCSIPEHSIRWKWSVPNQVGQVIWLFTDLGRHSFFILICLLKSSSDCFHFFFTLSVSWQLKLTAGLIFFLNFLLWCWV